MWDPRIAWLLFLVPLVVTLPLIPFLFRHVGFHSLWLLAFDAGGLAMALTYIVIGIKVRRLKTIPAAKLGDVSEALIAGRTFESPGVAILHDDTLELVPIAGESIPLVRKDIVAVREVTWFNGGRLWTKMGLILELEGGARIGVALPRPIGERWKAALSSKSEVGTYTGDRKPTTVFGGRMVTAARWTARVFSLLLMAFYGVFVLAEGLPPVAAQPGGVQLNFAALALMMLGFVIGWKRQGAAALLIASGWTLWHVSEGRMDWNLFQTPLPVAALYGFCWWATRGRQTRVVVTAVILLAALLGLGRLFVPTSVFVRGVVRDAQTGKPVPRAEMWLLPRPAPVGQKGDPPNTRADANGRFTLYVGWYTAPRELAITAPNYASLTTNLGPRVLGQREVKRDFLLQPDAASDEPKQVLGTLPPVVVRTVPATGATDVPPGVTEIRVTFSKPMADGSWSWASAWEDSLPESIGEAHYEPDRRTCVLKVKLEPGRTYAYWLNSGKFRNFQDRDGRAAVPYLLVFRTREGEVSP